MGLKIDGFEDLFGTLESLGNVGKKIGKSAVKDGLKEVLSQMKDDAPKDTSNSARNLEITRFKQYKGGSVWGACGIGLGNFEKTKGLWYQNFGYQNHGKRVEVNVGWMLKSFNKSKSKAQDIIMSSAYKEIDKILK